MIILYNFKLIYKLWICKFEKYNLVSLFLLTVIFDIP